MRYFFLLFVTGILLLGNEMERVPKVSDSLYIKECGSCHMAYQPQLLPTQSWEKMMINLENHFGTDASLEKEQVQTLSDYLRKHSRSSYQDNPEMAISKQRWFVREHRSIPQKIIDQKSIMTIANCAACHTRAEQGDYESLRIPGYPAWDDD